MLVYNPKKWFVWKFLFSKSDTLSKLWPFLVGIFIFSIGVAYWELEILHLRANSWVKNIPILHTMLGFVISLLLVFRTNTAYDRWWEGRKLWGSLINTSRNLAIKIAGILPENDTENKSFFAITIPLYAHTLRDHLQLEKTRLALDTFPHPELETLDEQRHLPNQIAAVMVQRLYDLKRQGKITETELWSLNQEISDFTNICGGCERIKNTPIPYAYSSFIKRFITLYILTLPFGYVFQLGYYVAPVITLILYVLGSLELIAEEIEDPFGFDENDLPTDKIASNIDKHVNEILR